MENTYKTTTIGKSYEVTRAFAKHGAGFKSLTLYGNKDTFFESVIVYKGEFSPWKVGVLLYEDPDWIEEFDDWRMFTFSNKGKAITFLKKIIDYSDELLNLVIEY